nr:hypothetical protein [Tanacetum cinerariifolium]
MANLSEDIQCAGSDTRPPMLDRNDFASWETLVEDKEGALHLGLEKARVYSNLSLEDKERFIKLINDMRNIKITMPRMQLNSKFINNILPEWGRFIIAVKLKKGLKESNYDQLYACLKQYEAHANENKMMLERFTQRTVDPLALMSNVSPQHYFSQSSTTPPSTHAPPITHRPHFADNTQLDSGLSPTDNLIENLTNTLSLLTQSYKTYLPQTNNQLRTSSNTRNQVTVQDSVAVNRGALYRVRNVNPSQARQIKCYNCNGGQDNAIDKDVDELPVQDLALNVDNVFQADECDMFDSDDDEAPTAQTMFMENLSSAYPVYDKVGPSYDSNILSEVLDHDNYQDVFCEHHEVHEMHDDVQSNCVVDSDVEYTGDSNMILYDQYVKDNAEPVVQNNVSFIPNDAYMMIINEIHEQPVQCVSMKVHIKVVDASLTAELATYKEQVKLYKIRGKFELTKREQKIEEQLRIVITDQHFEGIQKALTKEIKEMKEIFTELEAEVDQNAVNRKCNEIEGKNILIENDNLIVDCLSKEVFYITTNSELTISRFTEMHDAHAVVQARCLELEAELSKLNDMIEKDDHNELVKRFSNLE